jgi:hypothetical protein
MAYFLVIVFSSLTIRILLNKTIEMMVENQQLKDRYLILQQVSHE